MRYFGGKSRLAKELAKIINEFDVQSYHEPFCGMFNVGSLVNVPIRSGADVQQDLILLLQAVQDGWLGPESITEEEYKRLKSEEPSALRAFVGFGCSNSGKFFAGYARESTSRNFAANARSSLIKLAPQIKDVRFFVQTYTDFDKDTDMLYCDPPYSGTTKFSVGSFDSNEFWKWATEYSRRSILLVSEYDAPEWAPASTIWQKCVKTDMKDACNAKIDRIEKLYLVGKN